METISSRRPRGNFSRYLIRQWEPRAALPFLRIMQERIGRLLSDRKSDRRLWWGRKRQGAKTGAALHDDAYLVPRGERREAICSVLQFWCQFVRVDTLQIVRIDGVRGIDMRWMAEKIGLSHTRTKRAVRDLLACGWIGRYQPRDRQGSTFRGKAAIRWVTHKILDGLGCWRALCDLRKSRGLPAPRKPANGSPVVPTVAALADMMRFQT